MLIDTHAHLDDKQFDVDREETIQRAFESGISKIINIGAGLGSSRRSVELAKKYENIFASIGLHPHYFNEYREKSFEKIEEFKKLLECEKVVAIGEIGLDYFLPNGESLKKEEIDLQKKGFIFQLKLAKEKNLPVILHCRGSRESQDDAYYEMYEIISEPEFQNIKFVLHCFGGNLEFTKKLLLRENVFFSFTGNITYPKKDDAEIFEILKLIPLSKIMLETDCPYLSPAKMRGQRNGPSFVKFVAEKISEVKKVDFLEVEKKTENNSKSFFNV